MTYYLKIRLYALKSILTIYPVSVVGIYNLTQQQHHHRYRRGKLQCVFRIRQGLMLSIIMIIQKWHRANTIRYSGVIDLQDYCLFVLFSFLNEHIFITVLNLLRQSTYYILSHGDLCDKYKTK